MVAELAQRWEAGQQVSNVDVRKVIAGFVQTICDDGGEIAPPALQKRG
jgi:hypothetical protein